MVRTRAVPRGARPANVNFQRGNFARGKELRGKRNKGNFKIKFMLDRPKEVKVKHRGRQVREMVVRRRAVHLAKVRQRRC